jgi:hypothetical protein
MKISIVKSSKIDLGDRIDSEYFEPSYLDNENRLKRLHAQPLSNYCKLLSSAFYPAATDYYSIGEVPFVRCVDCIEFPAITTLQESSFEKLPISFIKENKTIKLLKREDIVITKVGTPCFSSIIYDLDEMALSRTVLGVCNIKDIDPYYLTVYLRSKYGYEQLFRERELTIQYQLTLERVGRILIYKPLNANFEALIRKIFIDSQNLFMYSHEKYNEAEQILLSNLGLLNWKPKHQLAFIKNFSDSKNANRIDAEYFQPIYDEINTKIKQYNKGYKKLDDIVSIKKGIEPGSEAYQENGIPFLRVSNLSKFGINSDNQQYISENLYKELKDYQPQKGEILLSKDASPGIAYLLNDETPNMIPSGGILRLKIKDSDNLYPEYLTLVLNSIIVQKQIVHDIGGSIINHWLVDQVKETLIPILPIPLQKEISKTIADSFIKRKQSKKLFDIARHGVEIAIEKNETEAEKWINQEVNNYAK